MASKPELVQTGATRNYRGSPISHRRCPAAQCPGGKRWPAPCGEVESNSFQDQSHSTSSARGIQGPLLRDLLRGNFKFDAVPDTATSARESRSKEANCQR